MKVCVDAGHGGTDPGAIGPTGLREADVSLRTALMLRNDLQEHGYTVMLTRAGEGALAAVKRQDLQLRAAKANNGGSDLFVSIHCNSFSDPGANGTETWYFRGSRRGERLASLVQQRLIVAGGLRDRGVKETDSLAVLRYTNMPAILVELAFISNPREESLLRSESWLAGMAKAMADSIAE